MTTNLDDLDWLADVAFGLVQLGNPWLAEFRAGLRPLMTREAPTGTYQLYLTSGGKPLVATNQYRLYVCEFPNKDRFGVMKISAHQSKDATKDDPNWLSPDEVLANRQLMENEAEVLRFLRARSMEIDQRQVMGGLEPYYHHSFFPELIDAYAIPNNRYVEIFGYVDDIQTVGQLTAVGRLMQPPPYEPYPGAQLVKSPPERSDLRALWVFGKLLKCLNHAHQSGVANNMVTPNNVLLCPEEHALVLFDWRYATKSAGRVSYEASCKEVISAAKVFTDLCGGTWDGSRLDLPYDADINVSPSQHERFRLHFERILSGKGGDSFSEHKLVYELTDETWPKRPNAAGALKRPFHKFRMHTL